MFSEAVVVRLSDPFVKSARKIYTYLNRRNENDVYVDEEGNEHEIPKGSQFAATVTLECNTELTVNFKDDEITTLLDQHGVNRCYGCKP